MRVGEIKIPLYVDENEPEAPCFTFAITKSSALSNQYEISQLFWHFFCVGYRSIGPQDN